MIRFFVLFIVLLMGLFTAEMFTWAQAHVILPFTAVLADISAWLMKLFDPDVASQGKIIRSLSNGFAVSIEPGCNGVEAVIILFAAMFAFPATFKQKLLGFSAGFLAIQALNLFRIISLFYLGQWSKLWFDWFHLYLWQALIILDALVVWLIWLRMISKKKSIETVPPTETESA